MAKLKITPELLEEIIFGYSENEVKINSIREIGDEFGNEYFEFDIKGIDIPDCEEVMCIVNVQENRIKQRLMTMKFSKIK